MAERTVEPPRRIRVGMLGELRRAGFLTAKVGSRPICVFLCDGTPYAVEDRCPHMGFPLHRGSVEAGLLTCHWHHARFDLASGGTLDPFADDVSAYRVEIIDDEVQVIIETGRDPVAKLRLRLTEGLEQGITLVIAKAVIGLLDAGVPSSEIIAAGVEFGVRYRGEGWGSGLTVLAAMANVLPVLALKDRSLALIHGLSFVATDTTGHAPRFAVAPLDEALPIDRLTAWYRAFIDTRSADAAERSLVSAIASGHDMPRVAALMSSAITDHVFIDEGHVLDFTNKAFECLEQIGWTQARSVLPSLVEQTARARRHEEESAWRHPIDLAALLADAAAELPGRLAAASDGDPISDRDLSDLAAVLLSEEPTVILSSLDGALRRGATLEQLGRAVAYAAALRILRFHTQNDHGDWNEVHHGFTAANALHQSIVRSPSPELLRGIYQCALRIYLDRFLNVPAARPPRRGDGPVDLGSLQGCWDVEGMVDEAGRLVFQYLANGGAAEDLLATLGHALLAEDAAFHWFQIYEASVRQFAAWPPGSEEGALILAGFARFLAAHTPTRRGLSQVARIAERLGRGEPLYEEAEP